jgi:hypothetical protein
MEERIVRSYSCPKLNATVTVSGTKFTLYGQSQFPITGGVRIERRSGMRECGEVFTKPPCLQPNSYGVGSDSRQGFSIN